MLKSFVEDRFIRHAFSGNLDVRDLIEARQFVERNQIDGQLLGVLWDFRLSYFTLADERYRILSQATANPGTLTVSTKRAFLVGSDEHFNRVEQTLESVKVPWPWGVFRDEDKAVEWLSDC